LNLKSVSLIIHLIGIHEKSSQGTTIHWHELKQINNLHMDGVPSLTQCLITPNESFIYEFDTQQQSGIYWYHSHYSRSKQSMEIILFIGNYS